MVTSNVRVPEEIWEEIKNIANEEERSINSEIIFILKKYIEEKNNNNNNSNNNN